MEHSALAEIAEELTRESPLALHEQLSGLLRTLVEGAGSESRIPSEEELVRTFQVSRTTVRRAIETLVDEGVLIRRQGRGTFLARPQVVQSLDQLRPFVDAFADDASVQARLINFGWISGIAVPAAIGGPEAQALKFERLYLSDDVPHALVRGLVTEELGRQIRRAQLEAHPIYHVLQNELHVVLREARVTVRCELAEPEIADWLKLDASSPLLVLERVTLTDGGRAVEVASHYLLPEVYRLRLTVAGGELPPLMRFPADRNLEAR
jgi:GntR family transcriptional regulator